MSSYQSHSTALLLILSKSEISNLAIICGCKAQFVKDLVRNPKDRFSCENKNSCDMAYLVNSIVYFTFCCHNKLELL